MTGFGQASVPIASASFSIEVRSVNHRFLDVRLRLPRNLSSLEVQVRERVAGTFSRGKVEVIVTSVEGSALRPELAIDMEVARQYAKAAGELSRGEDVSGPIDVGTLLSLPGVTSFNEPNLPQEELVESILEGVDQAASAAKQMRLVEGATLEREFLGRLQTVESFVAEITQRTDHVVEAARERLRKRAAQLEDEVGLVDPARLHQEIVIAADRLDVSEELSRLASHIDQFRKTLADGGPGVPAGRRLDFLLQELGREVNTIGSKGSDGPIAHLVVDLKTELERIREQVQNVE